LSVWVLNTAELREEEHVLAYGHFSYQNILLGAH
jgi:hypothetical protein